MLKPEAARRSLTQARAADWEERLLAATGRLPKELRGLARGLLGRDRKGLPIADAEEAEASGIALAKQLDELKKPERVRLFQALFPPIGRHVAAAWRLARQMPYQTGYDRKAFRAPGKASVSRAARMNWLRGLVAEIGGYDRELAWFAAWAGHLGAGYGAEQLSVVLAAAIDAGGKEGERVFETLRETVRGQHEVGRLGRPVIRALLLASRVGGWELIEQLLPSASVPRGISDAILATIDEAHPESFRRMLGVLVEFDLARDPRVVQALDVWFDFHWDAVSVGLVNRVLGQLVVFLDEPGARARALMSDDAETAYLALWAQGFDDAVAAVKPAARLLKDPNAERRFVAVHLLGQLALPAARQQLARALADPDLRVALHALEGYWGAAPDRADDKVLKRVERLLRRLPEERTHLEPIVWPWHVLTADKRALRAELIEASASRPARRGP
jgi:hypothetical protein